MANRHARSSPTQPEVHGSIRFNDIHDIELRLGFSPPYKTCHAYTKAGPQCCRSVNKDNRMSVLGLMRELLHCPVPSTAAGEILRQLSHCAVRGITMMHQDQASAVYEKWCALLLADFLAANGVRRSDFNYIG